MVSGDCLTYVTLPFIHLIWILFYSLLSHSFTIRKHELLAKKEIWPKRLIVFVCLEKCSTEHLKLFMASSFLCDSKTDISHIALSRPGHIVWLFFFSFFFLPPFYWIEHFELHWKLVCVRIVLIPIIFCFLRFFLGSKNYLFSNSELTFVRPNKALINCHQYIMFP